MIEDIMENEKYEDMKRRAEDRTRWKWRRQQQKEDTPTSRTPKEEHGYCPDSNNHFAISTDGHRPLAKITN